MTQTPDIVYQDNHVLVCIKPFNIPSQADSSCDMDMLTILKAYLKREEHKPGNVYLGLVHRLDRPAGGLMVFAKTSKAAARLAIQMQSGLFEKRYLLRTVRAPQNMEGELSDYLIKGTGNLVRIAQEGESGAKLARLAYRVLKVEPDGSALLEVNLLTGRTHQIRVQFASRGYPLMGDARYGSGRCQLKLWSAHLSFRHPVKTELMAFDAPLPMGF